MGDAVNDELRKRGFSLSYPDGHVVLLIHEGERVAVFSQSGVTREAIDAECENHLSREHDLNQISFVDEMKDQPRVGQG